MRSSSKGRTGNTKGQKAQGRHMNGNTARHKGRNGGEITEGKTCSGR